MQRPSLNERELLTVPELSRRTGIGPKRLREAVQTGALPVYDAGSHWPRVLWADFLVWLRSTRVPARASGEAHARARVAEVVEREDRVRV